MEIRHAFSRFASRISEDSRPTWAMPWPSVRWMYSALLPVSLLLLLLTMALAGPRTPTMEIRVLSSTSGEAMPGALVSVGETFYEADDQGRVVVARPEADVAVSARVDGFSVVDMPVRESGNVRMIQMQPSLVSGVVRDAESGEPISSAELVLEGEDAGEAISLHTDASGTYIFKNVPPGAVLRISAVGYRSTDVEIGERQQLDIALDSSVVQGKIVDDASQPIRGAVVHANGGWTRSGDDGVFTLDQLASGDEVKVTAPGFRTRTVTHLGNEIAEIRMEPELIKAVYANWGLLADPDGLDSLIRIAQATEINAIVIDIKQDTVYYDSQVQFFRDAGTVSPLYDVAEVLDKLEQNGIYPIARLVVFQDPLVAEAFPHLAVHDTEGGLWRNEMGIAWVSAFHEELWDANIALAVEAIELGFREVQYDYVRFPTDGDLARADFGREYTADARQAAITEFMRRSYDAVHNAGGILAADLFGFVTIVDDEQYIGQRYSELEPFVDYVCMMIYPSHFTEGNIASAPGHPNDFPYETIYESLERAELITPDATRKFRPWLQDFSYWKMRPYGPSDVRAQIDAAEDFGASGWMLWGDPFNVTVEALGADT